MKIGNKEYPKSDLIKFIAEVLSEDQLNDSATISTYNKNLLKDLLKVDNFTDQDLNEISDKFKNNLGNTRVKKQEIAKDFKAKELPSDKKLRGSYNQEIKSLIDSFRQKLEQRKIDQLSSEITNWKPVDMEYRASLVRKRVADLIGPEEIKLEQPSGFLGTTFSNFAGLLGFPTAKKTSLKDFITKDSDSEKQDSNPEKQEEVGNFVSLNPFQTSNLKTAIINYDYDASELDIIINSNSKESGHHSFDILKVDKGLFVPTKTGLLSKDNGKSFIKDNDGNHVIILPAIDDANSDLGSKLSEYIQNNFGAISTFANGQKLKLLIPYKENPTSTWSLGKIILTPQPENNLKFDISATSHNPSGPGNFSNKLQDKIKNSFGGLSKNIKFRTSPAPIKKIRNQDSGLFVAEAIRKLTTQNLQDNLWNFPEFKNIPDQNLQTYVDLGKFRAYDLMRIYSPESIIPLHAKLLSEVIEKGESPTERINKEINKIINNEDLVMKPEALALSAAAFFSIYANRFLLEPSQQLSDPVNSLDVQKSNPRGSLPITLINPEIKDSSSLVASSNFDQSHRGLQFLTRRPTSKPTNKPTLSTSSPSVAPTQQTLSPSPSPSLAPTNSPSQSPTLYPTLLPTLDPTGKPTGNYTATFSPTPSPTVYVLRNETFVPSTEPTNEPTFFPSVDPETLQPTFVPTTIPTINPTTGLPTTIPTVMPSFTPTIDPTTRKPTLRPTFNPSSLPTHFPTDNPTAAPTPIPSWTPTFVPSFNPSAKPTDKPTLIPTLVPTTNPTQLPTYVPSTNPTIQPSLVPSNHPSAVPSGQPSFFATFDPTNPSASPTFVPTQTPTIDLTTGELTRMPTQIPSFKVTYFETGQPTFTPSSIQSNQPTATNSTEQKPGKPKDFIDENFKYYAIGGFAGIVVTILAIALRKKALEYANDFLFSPVIVKEDEESVLDESSRPSILALENFDDSISSISSDTYRDLASTTIFDDLPNHEKAKEEIALINGNQKLRDCYLQIQTSLNPLVLAYIVMQTDEFRQNPSLSSKALDGASKVLSLPIVSSVISSSALVLRTVQNEAKKEEFSNFKVLVPDGDITKSGKIVESIARNIVIKNEEAILSQPNFDGAEIGKSIAKTIKTHITSGLVPQGVSMREVKENIVDNCRISEIRKPTATKLASTKENRVAPVPL